MIACFPDPHPDELLYSVCARFDGEMIYPDRGTAAQRMFGVRHNPSIDLPNRIDHLIGSILPPHCYTADGLIDDNTLLPFYAPFVPSERALAVRKEMRKSGSHIYERLGITAGGLRQPLSLKFCPECVAADREKVGQTYWHRVHQLPGIEVCPDHAVFLESGTPWLTSKNGYGVMAAEGAVCSVNLRALDLTDRRHAALLQIAKGAAWLLKWRCQGMNLEQLRERYYNILLRRGLAFYNGRIRSSELTEKFVGFYTPALLESLQCSIGNQNNHWLMRLVRTGRTGVAQHPLRHLLLMTFLGTTPEEVFTRFEEFKPFGDGPWPCLSKASGHYRLPRATCCRVEDGFKKNYGKPVGTFICECGFSYTRTGPDLTEEDRYKSSSTQSYGPVWEQSLQELWVDMSVTIREIAGKLGVGQMTVIRRAILLGLAYPRDASKSQPADKALPKRYLIVRKPIDEETTARREQLVALRKDNPTAGRLQLQKLAPSLLDWLRRYDAEWLEGHLPPISESNLRPVRLDWDDWDRKLAVEVEAAASVVRNSEGRPVRVSMTAIVNIVGHRAWFEKKLDRLPLTTEVVNKHLESHEDYFIRRVRWAENYCRERGIISTRHKLESLAGTENRVGKTKKVEAAIEAALKCLAG